MGASMKDAVPFICRLEASSYASSFDSKLYPGRRVPDRFGLVGKKVKIGMASMRHL